MWDGTVWPLAHIWDVIPNWEQLKTCLEVLRTSGFQVQAHLLEFHMLKISKLSWGLPWKNAELWPTGVGLLCKLNCYLGHDV